MAPLPKKKRSNARQGKKRAHLHRQQPALSACPQCHSLRLSHRACPTCGNYAGREAIAVKIPKAKKE